MSGEVEASHAEADLKALEGLREGNQCAARPLQHLRGHRMVLEMATRTSGCQGIQDPQRIERDGELYHKQEMSSEG